MSEEEHWAWRTVGWVPIPAPLSDSAEPPFTDLSNGYNNELASLGRCEGYYGRVQFGTWYKAGTQGSLLNFNSAV